MGKIMMTCNHYFGRFMKDERAIDGIVSRLHGLTVIMIMVALVTLPIGYKILNTVNKTALGITAGSTEDTIVSSLGTIVLAVLAMAFVGLLDMKKR